MAETPFSKFRLAAHTLADLDALAASNGGVRSAALRDAVHYWHRLVADAGRANADELPRDDWVRLAHLNDPDPLPPGLDDDAPVAVDWSARLAAELVGMWEGKPLLPLHRTEKKECERLARQIAGWGLVRGYALVNALRHFWREPSAGRGGGEWWHPETWMTPTAQSATPKENRNAN